MNVCCCLQEEIRNKGRGEQKTKKWGRMRSGRKIGKARGGRLSLFQELMAKNRILIDLCVVMHWVRWAQVHTHTLSLSLSRTRTNRQLFSAQYNCSKKKSWVLENWFCFTSSHLILAILGVSGVISTVSRNGYFWIKIGKEDVKGNSPLFVLIMLVFLFIKANWSQLGLFCISWLN